MPDEPPLPSPEPESAPPPVSGSLERIAALADLVGLVYRAAAEPALWDRVVLALREIFACQVALITVRGDRLLNVLLSACADAAAASWPPEWMRWAGLEGRGDEALASNPARDGACPPEPARDGACPPEPARDGAPGPADRVAVCVLDAGPAGGARSLGAVVAGEGGGAALVGLWREPDAAPFGRSEEAELGLILPHLGRALRLRSTILRWTAEGAAWRALAEAMDLPALLVAPDLTLLEASPAGRRALARGTPLRLVAGRIAADGRTPTQRLLRALTEPATFRTLDLGEGEAGRVQLLRTQDAVARGATLIVAGEIARVHAPVSIADFRLSPTETRIATLLAQGLPLHRIAGQLGSSLETVRTHLKRIKAKTGTRRQAELVQVLLTGRKARKR